MNYTNLLKELEQNNIPYSVSDKLEFTLFDNKHEFRVEIDTEVRLLETVEDWEILISDKHYLLTLYENGISIYANNNQLVYRSLDKLDINLKSLQDFVNKVHNI